MSSHEYSEGQKVLYKPDLSKREEQTGYIQKIIVGGESVRPNIESGKPSTPRYVISGKNCIQYFLDY